MHWAIGKGWDEDLSKLGGSSRRSPDDFIAVFCERRVRRLKTTGKTSSRLDAAGAVETVALGDCPNRCRTLGPRVADVVSESASQRRTSHWSNA